MYLQHEGFSLSDVFIFLFTPGHEEAVVNRLYPCRRGSYLGHGTVFWFFAVWKSLMFFKLMCQKQSKAVCHEHANTLWSLGRWGCQHSHQCSFSKRSGIIQCVKSDLPVPPETLLSNELRNRVGQTLYKPGARSKVIVICDTTLKGAPVKSAVTVECRSYNEASGFTLLFIVWCSGTLCCLFIGS